MEYVLGNKSLSQAVENAFVAQFEVMEEEGSLDMLTQVLDDEQQVSAVVMHSLFTVYKEKAHLFAFILINGKEGSPLIL